MLPTPTASFYVDVEEFLRRTALKADALRVGTDIEGVEGPAGHLGGDRSDSNPLQLEALVQLWASSTGCR